MEYTYTGIGLVQVCQSNTSDYLEEHFSPNLKISLLLRLMTQLRSLISSRASSSIPFTLADGCRPKIAHIDKILSAFDAFSRSHFLEFTCPTTIHRNQPLTVTVTDRSIRVAIQGASVGGQSTMLTAKPTLTFGSVGVKHLKAEKSDSICSNSLDVVVLPQHTGLVNMFSQGVPEIYGSCRSGVKRIL